VFSRVSSIAATGSDQVTITLKQPDYWLEGELASMPGIIIEKSFAQQQGKNYGTPAGRIMCTGAYMFKSWNPGVGVVAVANPHYWNSSAAPLVHQITIKGAPDVSAFTSAMLTNGIQGSYSFALPTLDQLEGSSSVKVALAAARPDIAQTAHRLRAIPGRPLSAFEAPPSECAFAPRCPHARDICLTGVPALAGLDGGLSRCARAYELRGQLQEVPRA
jgi:peptide/nickel transport system substrate-binding protein